MVVVMVIVWSLVVLSLGYMLPFGISYSRGQRNMLSVFLVNLFLGWTIVGWIYALLIAVRPEPRFQRAQA